MNSKDVDAAIGKLINAILEEGAKKCNIPEEFFDVDKIIEFGAKKHGKDSFLDADNESMQHNSNCASMFRHLSAVQSGIEADHETGESHLLHLATRALMAYTRLKRGI